MRFDFDARPIQQRLNTVAKAGLVVDGVCGKATIAALMRAAVGSGTAPLATALAPELATRLPAQGIVTAPEIQMFLAQSCVETDGFRTLKEYGGAKYFARYDGRKDLGNTQPGDGARFPGRGVLQTTGRYNYTQLHKITGIDCVEHPELLEQPGPAVESAAIYWVKRELRTPALAGDVLRCTKLINGGTNGFEERKAAYARLGRVMP